MSTGEQTNIERDAIRVHEKGLKDNRDYYDEFSDWYEKERHHGYHAFLDDMALRLVRPYAEGRRVLEIGSGTGLILSRVSELTDRAFGMDISHGMLSKGAERGLRTTQASATDLPFPDDTFDLIYSFKVLAHVQDIDKALAEMARITRPGGHLVLEFYNRNSLRWLLKRLKPAHAISGGTTDHEVFTRYEGVGDLVKRLPAGLRLRAVNGIRVVTPFAGVLNNRFLGPWVTRLEQKLAVSPLARFAGFVVLVLEKR